MAIRMRRGNKADLIKSRLIAGEFAIVLDTHEVFICFGDNDVRQLTTLEDIEKIIGLSPTMFAALQELISAMQSEPVITGILADIQHLKDIAVAATVSNIGLVKPDDVTIKIAPDGTIDAQPLLTQINNIKQDITSIKDDLSYSNNYVQKGDFGLSWANTTSGIYFRRIGRNIRFSLILDIGVQTTLNGSTDYNIGKGYIPSWALGENELARFPIFAGYGVVGVLIINIGSNTTNILLRFLNNITLNVGSSLSVYDNYFI